MKKVTIKKFIKKLKAILQNFQNNHVISWDVNGTHILIKDLQQFEKQVIPKHFRLKKLSSFVRQLHLYDFHKVKSKQYPLTFINQYFIRDNEDKLKFIRRKRMTKALQLEMARNSHLIQSETKINIENEKNFILSDQPNFNRQKHCQQDQNLMLQFFDQGGIKYDGSIWIE